MSNIINEQTKSLQENLFETDEFELRFDDNITMNEWFSLWLKEYKLLSVKKSTLIMYDSNYMRYVYETLGIYPIKNIKSIHIQKLYNDLRAREISIGTIKIIHSVLNNMFKYAFQNDFIKKNPCEGILLPTIIYNRPNVLTKKEQNLFLKCVQGNFYEPLYLTALATGLRIGEITALTWEDIDFENNSLSVNKTLLYQKDYEEDRNNFQIQSPKSASGIRKIPLIPHIVSVLKQHKKDQEDYKIRNAKRWRPIEKLGNLVFTTRNGTPIQEVYIVKRLYGICKMMNEIEEKNAKLEQRPVEPIKRLTPHTLRHSFATRAFESGMLPKTVQVIMGHSSINITMNLYTHLIDDVKKKEMEKLANILEIEQD